MSDKKVIYTDTVDGTMIASNGFISKPELQLYPKVMVTARAEFARRIIERFALIVGKPDGEDSTGRSKATNMTPPEIVKHCCDVSDAAYDEFKKRGWTIETPHYEEFFSN